MSSRLALTVVGTAVVVGACATAGSAPTSTEGADSTTLPTTTSRTSPSSNTTSTTLPASATPRPPKISLYGSELVYSNDGIVELEGEVDDAIEVTANGEPVQTWEAGEQLGFTVGLSLTAGEHVVDIRATNESGLATVETVTVVVDPALEVQIGYLTRIDAAGGVVVADYAEWLTGEQAVAAARDDGAIGADEDLPGGFYIRNRNPRLRTLDLADDVVIVLQACYPDEGPCVVPQRIDVGTFDSLWTDPESGYDVAGWWWFGTGELPYWLTLRDGTVVQISEQYLP